VARRAFPSAGRAGVLLDAAILSGGFNRSNRAFLADCCATWTRRCARGAPGLIIRGGDVVAETAKLARRVRADAVHVAGDVSGYAQRREQELTAELACELVMHEDALFAVPPGRIRPSGGAGHMSVFAAYYRS
jgi:deoxyribodipyrimidine photo-lyase